MLRTELKASGESGVDFEKVVIGIAPGVIDGTRPAHRDYPRREASLIRPRRGCREGAPAAPDHCSKPVWQAKTPAPAQTATLDRACRCLACTSARNSLTFAEQRRASAVSTRSKA